MSAAAIAVDPYWNVTRQRGAYLTHCQTHGYQLSYIVRTIDGLRNAVDLIRARHVEIIVTGMPAFFDGEIARIEPDITAAGGRIEYVAPLRAATLDVYMAAQLRRRGNMTPQRIAQLTDLSPIEIRELLGWL